MKTECVYFKNSSTGKTIQIELDITIPLCSLRGSIHEKIITSLDINETYKIVKERQPLFEHGDNIDESSEMQINKLFPDSHFMGFYITPNSFVSTITPNSCYICYNTVIHTNTEFTCSHDRNICVQCIGSWRENCAKNYKQPTCPICRAQI
jgi:hypothetical protein